MPVFDFMGRNMPVSEFSKLTSKPVATIRDWNKRGMAIGIGQPGPNGHWLYSGQDVLSVALAQSYKGQGFNWADALWIGHMVCGNLVGDMMHGRDGGYGRKYLVFYHDNSAGIEGLHHIACDEPSGAFSDILSLSRLGDAPPVFHVIDLVWTFNNLDKSFQTALLGLRAD